MRVLRHRQLLVCLAMLVFAMQGILAFAQTHKHTWPRTGLEQLAARAITYGMCRPGEQKPCTPATPHKDHDGCALCWSLAMAGAGVIESPPIVPPRAQIAVVIAPLRLAGLVHGNVHQNFQARAPPIA